MFRQIKIENFQYKSKRTESQLHKFWSSFSLKNIKISEKTSHLQHIFLIRATLSYLQYTINLSAVVEIKGMLL